MKRKLSQANNFAWDFLFTFAITFCLIALFPIHSFADTLTFESPLVWRADGAGDYTFKDNVKLSGSQIAADGAVEFVSDPAACELTSANETNDLIISASVTWEFTGKVAMQLSVTGNPSDYVTVTNSVPVEFSKNSGKLLRWKATLLEPGSRLTQVRISYKDASGVAGSFGAPELSGFNFKKTIWINGSSAGDLYNFQTSVVIAQSDQAKGCDAFLKGVLQADFDDVRFTAADGETLLPYYAESVSGASGLRAAKFWLKIPQIPKAGLPIYVYYGKLGGQSLSNAAGVFDFYYDFTSKVFDQAKWEAVDLSQGIIEYKLNSADAIQAIDRKIYPGQEDIINFFKANSDFAWARQRKTISSSGDWKLVDAAKTADLGEEIPNLPVFQGTDVALNGDLVLAKQASQGTYSSGFIYPAFKTRIMIPQWKADTAAGSAISADINAVGDDASYLKSCASANYYYASKKDFTGGQVLRWRANLSRQDASAQSPALKEFTLDFRAGAISVTAPAKAAQITKASGYMVLWNATDYEPTYLFKAEYSSDNGKTYQVITPKTENSGKFYWQVPAATAAQAKIRIADSLDDSVYGDSGVFAVAEQGQLQIITPEAIQPAGEQTKEESALEAELKKEAEKDKQHRAGSKPYELLIKIGDSPLAQGYKDGDIVMIQPAGYLWGTEERGKFFIVKVYLTAQEAKELMAAPDAAAAKDKANPVGRRKYRLNLQKIGIPKGATPDLLSASERKSLAADVGEVEQK